MVNRTVQEFNLKYIGVAVFSLIFGGALTGTVFAAIPSSDSTIHGCYTKVSGSLRVINAEGGKSCTSLENSLTWSNSSAGPQLNAAYAKFAQADVPLEEASLDPNFTVGILNSKVGSDDNSWCFDVAFSPKVSWVYPGGTVSARGISQAYDDNINQYCGTSYEAMANLSGLTDSSVFVFQR